VGPRISASNGPLTGLRVVDLTHHLAGPTCALMLADMGADVIKVERMPGGDDSRRSIPPAIADQSAAFMMMNRNKRAIAVDLKTDGGKRVLRRLAESADVLIENYRPGTLEKLGLGYEDLKAFNPRLIYGAISGFGRTGPYRGRGGFDLVAQGMSGLMSITGEGAGRPPTKVGAPVTDITAGMLLTMGVLAATYERNRTGEGQVVDTSLFEAGITHTFWQSAIAFATGTAPLAMGSRHPLNAPYQAFRTRDSWMCLGAASQRNWKRLMDLVDRPDIADDPRFADNAGRMANLDALDDALSDVFATATTAEWLARFEEAGIPAGPILNVRQMHADPQTLEREMVREVDHPKAGRVKTLGPPIKFSRTPGSVRRAAPLFGQHTREVLAEHGFTEEEIDDLAAAGAIFDGTSG
jgi:crotonobetainyl-CoA:carnitine CoA-transferase CaiB-like acyl-CoA transferase